MQRNYSVVGNRPRLVFERIEDATIEGETRIKIITKKLVDGRWKRSVRWVKREE